MSKSILTSVFALALFAGSGVSVTATNASFVPAAYASSDDDAAVPGNCQCTAPGGGTGTPRAAFQSF